MNCIQPSDMTHNTVINTHEANQEEVSSRNTREFLRSQAQADPLAAGPTSSEPPPESKQWGKNNSRDNEKIRIAIADDHAVLRESLSALLATQPDFEVVGSSGNGHEA